MKLPDYSIASPWMKQQYTYLDLKAAFEAGYVLDGFYPIHKEFDEWFKDYKFEMLKKKENDIR